MDNEMKTLLQSSRVIAVVGISAKPDRPSFYVSEYMRAQGYEIVPVNPVLKEWQGLQAFPDLKSIPGKVDIVNIFRKSEDVPPIVEAAIQTDAKAIWMQLGIVNEAAAKRAQEAGLQVVMDRCIMVEHRSL